MSVLKSKRQESRFEVFHHYYRLRKEITDLLLRDFGFSPVKAEARVKKLFKDKSEDEMDGKELERYIRTVNRNRSFEAWFIVEERETVLTYLRELGAHVFTANNIYPQYMSELEERRLYQDKAIGSCESLRQELQYAIETLPVDINKFTRFDKMLEDEISLIKAWRKSDNKFKKTINQPPDKTDLLNEYVENARLNENDYTADSWIMFEILMENARNVLADPDTTQDKIDGSLLELTSAKNSLVPYWSTYTDEAD